MGKAAREFWAWGKGRLSNGHFLKSEFLRILERQ